MATPRAGPTPRTGKILQLQKEIEAARREFPAFSRAQSNSSTFNPKVPHLSIVVRSSLHSRSFVADCLHRDQTYSPPQKNGFKSSLRKPKKREGGLYDTAVSLLLFRPSCPYPPHMRTH